MSHNSKFARIDGIVVEALPGLVFKVNILVKNEEGKEEEKEVLGHLAGKLKINHIRIIPGDRVSLEMPDVNDRRGRIVRRL
ncbi:MAG: translation initiation factor IF-1 [Patescibacteria group bacterium]